MNSNPLFQGTATCTYRLQPYLAEFIERAKAGGERAFFNRLTAEWIWNMPDDLTRHQAEAVMDFLTKFTASEDGECKPARQPEKMRRAGVQSRRRCPAA